MLSLLIADDEKVIRESLAECLDWAAIGIRVVGCCADGLEALEAILDDPPDIVMTDIKMPGLNGLDLIEKMQEIDRNIEFIILSGYREFDFAHKAIALGVRRYLLKPVSEEAVLESVLDAVRSWEKKRSVKMTMEEYKQPLSQVSQYYRQQLQYALLCAEGPVKQAVAAYLERFPNRGKGCFVLAVCALTLDEARQLARILAQPLAAAGLNAVTDFLFAKDMLAIILNGTALGVDALVKERAALVSAAACASVFEGVSLEACVERLRQEWAPSAHLYALDENGRSYPLHSAASSLDIMRQLPEQLLALMQEGEKESAEALIRRCFASVGTLNTLRAMGAYLISCILVQGRLPCVAGGNYEGIFEDIYREGERDVLVDKVARIALALLGEEKSDNHMIQAVKAHVRNNLADSFLSLKQIADHHVHVNADYLSRLFVQKTGEKFSHYLNRKRVEKAKQLLQADSSKVYQVAEQVGLGHNPRYFGQVFKKYTGMTPSAYVERQTAIAEPSALGGVDNT